MVRGTALSLVHHPVPRQVAVQERAGRLCPHWAGLGALGALPRRGGLWDRDGGSAEHRLDAAESPPTAPAGSPLAGTAAGGTFPRVMENKVLMSFAFYSTILILKMYVVAIITGQVRLRKKAFANPEDALRNGGLQYHREDPDVERCRRAHRNDMENIFPFLFLGAIYSLLDPSPAVARIHFFIFCVGRIVHTVAYLLKLKAPTRSVAYSVAQLPCFSMALQILLATTPYW